MIAAYSRHSRVAPHGGCFELGNPHHRRCHDALVLLAERGTAAGPGSDTPDPLVNVVMDWETFQQAVAELADEDLNPNYHTDGTCELLDGTPITPQQGIELASLGHVARIVVGADDVVINAGRSRRLFNGRMRQILNIRDRHCTWPGCDLPPSRCEADHITPWAQGGQTNLNNARLLCRYHHRHLRKPQSPLGL